MMRPAMSALTLGALVAAASSGRARAAGRCPSYELGTSDGTHHCGVAAHAGTDPDMALWKADFQLAAQGPGQWGDRGVPIADLKAGCQAGEKVHAAFPCEILGALALLESGWHQFCVPTEPASERNKPAQTLITRDCGHGVTQVTSGMHQGEKASFDRDRVASDPFYNLSVGASILASKWQASDCVGAQDPAELEDWYQALWRYNGYSYSNDPSNPAFSSTRGVWNPAIGGDAPYQEKVFGIVELGSLKGKRWTPIALAYPRIEDVAGGARKRIPTPSCASPTDCTQHRPTHRTLCVFAEASSAGTGSGGHQGQTGASTDATPAGRNGHEAKTNPTAPPLAMAGGPAPTAQKGCGCAHAPAPVATALLWVAWEWRRRRPRTDPRP